MKNKYPLVLLTLVFAYNQVDRLAFSLLLQDIKVELHLSDSQLGLLTGLLFALFYATVGIPLARIADKGHRVSIIAGATALWSVASALTGMAGSFAQLVLVRISAAVGESGCVPPSHSLLSAYFDRESRPRAFSIYNMGTPISAIIAFIGAGWLNEYFGWRTTFLLLALPGFLLALLVWRTLREPGRAEGPALTPPGDPVTPPRESFAATAAWLRTNRTFCRLLFAYCIVSLFGFGVAKWQAAFFIRSYGFSTGELGTWFAMIYGVGGFAGLYAGGELASRFAANNESRQMRWLSMAFIAFAFLKAGVFIAPNYLLSFLFLGLATFGNSLALGPLFSSLQAVVPGRMRATAVAILYLFANLLGMGLGPLAAGVISDALHPWLGEESLRYALLMLCPGFFLAAWFLWRTGKSISGDIERAKASEV
jgi:predicted MFS family arabinose efflux permease